MSRHEVAPGERLVRHAVPDGDRERRPEHRARVGAGVELPVLPARIGAVGQVGQERRVEGPSGERFTIYYARTGTPASAKPEADQLLLSVPVSAVLDSASITAEKALELKVIDFIATDMNDLLNKMDEKTVKTAAGDIERGESISSALSKPGVRSSRSPPWFRRRCGTRKISR